MIRTYFNNFISSSRFKSGSKRKQLYQSLFQPQKPIIQKTKEIEIKPQLEVCINEPSTFVSCEGRTRTMISEIQESSEECFKTPAKLYNIEQSYMEEYEYVNPILLECKVFWALVRRDSKKLFKYIEESKIPSCDKIFLKISQ